ncbi:sulfatase [Arthrobacter sp.]|uniref:sulfatase family protein n=1 Tax=Arthrobacter sp. TaxID=1667 RepID=UPI0026DF91CC|nr:sulfatase-like hydrolase/transferase [Arthrobacter sp.]MDO5752990.1 sulfatase-like hydrolase/transferase [Arthrobacter sp.]
MNILLIMADQFSAHALERSRSTDAHFNTPHLDRLVANSTYFSQAYTPFPLCVPARSSMVTGKYPHQLGIMSNSGAGAAPAVEPGHGPESLGHWFTEAGYDCAYAGKWHALQASATEADGFAPIHPFGDDGLVEACHEWLANRSVRDGERPFLLVASFDDPHTICEYARSQPLPYGNVPEVPIGAAPPLPANFPPAPYAPSALASEADASPKVYGTRDYTADDWRAYRAAYGTLVARVDERIGRLLDAVDLAETAVVFVSDHGDGDASHGWNQKTALYQECIRVPLLVHVPGQSPAKVDTPVDGVLALMPTLCQVAGIATPASLPCRSVLEAQPETVVVATLFDSGSKPQTTGRALIKGQHKYTVYSWGKHREQLHDLHDDPGEQRNLAVEDSSAALLEEMRGELYRWAVTHSDTSFLKKLVLPVSAPAQAHSGIFTVPY